MLFQNIFRRELHGKEDLLSFLKSKNPLRCFQVYESQLEIILMKGHVLFGFLKNNTLLLSYQILEDEFGIQIGLVIYLWYFLPNFSIGKVFEKQIFVNEKFSTEKFIALQWPDNDSKLIILCQGKTFSIYGDSNYQAYLVICTIPNFLTVYRNDVEALYIETKYEIPETYQFNKLVTLLSNESLLIVTNYSVIVLSIVSNDLREAKTSNKKDDSCNKNDVSLYDLKIKSFYQDMTIVNTKYIANYEEKENLNSEEILKQLIKISSPSSNNFQLSKNIFDKNMLYYLKVDKLQDLCLNLIEENSSYNNCTVISEQYFSLKNDHGEPNGVGNENILPINVFLSNQKLNSKNSLNSSSEKNILKIKQSHLDIDALIITLINNYKIINKYEYTRKCIGVCSISHIIMFEVQLFYYFITTQKSFFTESTNRKCLLYTSWNYETGEAKILNILEPFCDYHGLSFERFFASLPSYLLRSEYEPLVLRNNDSSRSVNRIVDNENIFLIHCDNDMHDDSSSDNRSTDNNSISSSRFNYTTDEYSSDSF